MIKNNVNINDTDRYIVNIKLTLKEILKQMFKKFRPEEVFRTWDLTHRTILSCIW